MVRRKSLRKLKTQFLYNTTVKAENSEAYSIDMRRRVEVYQIISVSGKNIINSMATLVDLKFASDDISENKIELRNVLEKFTNTEFVENIWDPCKTSGIIEDTPRHYE